MAPILPTGAHPTLIDLPYNEKQGEIKELQPNAVNSSAARLAQVKEEADELFSNISTNDEFS